MAKRRGRRPTKWGFKYANEFQLRSGVLTCSAVSDVAVPSRFSSCNPPDQVTSPAADEKFNCGLVLHPSAVTTRNARRLATCDVSIDTCRNTLRLRNARSLSTARAES